MQMSEYSDRITCSDLKIGVASQSGAPTTTNTSLGSVSQPLIGRSLPKPKIGQV